MPQESFRQIDIAVYMVTYNHELFIAQAIEGIINQKTKYKFKLFIGEDCSTDNTKSICLNYQNKYPESIEVISTQTNNLKQNVKNIFGKCFNSTAKYVAMCEGDDYWTDPNKLQKQVDFLEANLDYSICFHAVNILKKGEEQPSILNRSHKEETYSILDLAVTNIIHTPSVVFRNHGLKEFPAWFSQSHVGDYVLHLLNAKKGLIYYLPEIMAVYRVHDNGNWSQKHATDVYPKWLWLLERLIEEDFESAVVDLFRQQKTRMLNQYIEWLFYQNEFDLLKAALHTYYCDDDAATINFVTDLFLKKINDSKNHLDVLENSKSYVFARKLSKLKTSTLSLFNMKS